jgi:hypothetical protein
MIRMQEHLISFYLQTSQVYTLVLPLTSPGYYKVLTYLESTLRLKFLQVPCVLILKLLLLEGPLVNVI